MMDLALNFNRDTVFLVTGAAGFIGSHIIEKLLKHGFKVRGLDNFSNGKRGNLTFANTLNPHSFQLVEGDIRDLDTCRRICEGVDYVLHQAALGSVARSINEPLLYDINNITGTVNMLVAARDAQVKAFIYACSGSIYGDTEVLPKVETMHPNPKSPYAVTKLVGEIYCKVFYEVYGLRTISLRYFNIFGPRQDAKSQYAAVIPKFITALLNREPPTIYGDGEQTRDFTYVENVVFANLLACLAPDEAWGQAFNIACGNQISVNQLYNTLVDVIDIKDNTSHELRPKYTDPRPGDIRHSLADISKARRLLGYEPKVDFREGIIKTVNWYKIARS
jgi:UDP-N-acetylglucosamine 4-epimerase